MYDSEGSLFRAEMNRKRWERNPKLIEEDQFKVNLFLIIVTIVCTTGVAYHLYQNFPAWLSSLTKRYSAMNIKIGVFTTICIASLILFLLKKFFQLYYGVSEVTYGAVTAWYASENLSNDLIHFTKWLPIIAAAYLIVRGISNCSEARAKKNDSKQNNEEQNKQKEPTPNITS